MNWETVSCTLEEEQTAELGDKYNPQYSTREGNFTLEKSNFGDKFFEISLTRALIPKWWSKLAVPMMETREFLQQK